MARRPTRTRAAAACALLALPLATQDPLRPTVDVDSLLALLGDRRALARWPEPAYALGHDSRLEAPGGVQLEVTGPGAIANISTFTHGGRLRVHVDGAEEPVIDFDVLSLGERRQLSLPIPFARSCRILSDRPKGMLTSIDYRLYDPGTAVRSFAAKDLDRATTAVERHLSSAESPWDDADSGVETFTYTLSEESPEGGLVPVDPRRATGPRAVTELHLRAESASLAEDLRRSVIRMSFDGEETVACPFLDFFVAPRLQSHQRWTIRVQPGIDPPRGRADEQIDFACRWIMPYRDRFEFSIDGAPPTLHVAGLVRTEPWKWDDRSMLFHASTRSTPAITAQPAGSWPFLAIEGRGVLVADTLHIDVSKAVGGFARRERMHVDGEVRIPQFGVGANLDGRVIRIRNIDALPFKSSLRRELLLPDVLKDGPAISATSFFYARPGAKDEIGTK